MSFGVTIAPSAAYYLWPPRWVGAAPPSTIWKTPSQEPAIDKAELAEVVFEKPQTNDLRSRVYRDGLIIYDRPAWRERGTLGNPPMQGDLLADYAGPRMRLINAHMACLAVSMNRFELRTAIVTGESLLGFDYDGPEVGLSTAGFEPAFMELFLARLQNNPNWMDWRFSRRHMQPIEIDEIERSYRLLDELLERPDRADALLHAELLARSQTALADGDPSGALVYAWTATEGLLAELFRRYLDENQARDVGRDGSGNKLKFIDAKRRKFLESKEVGARIRTEILSLADQLPFALAQTIESCRKARNGWLHEREQVTLAQAASALEAARELFTLTEGVNLRPYRLDSTDE